MWIVSKISEQLDFSGSQLAKVSLKDDAYERQPGKTGQACAPRQGMTVALALTLEWAAEARVYCIYTRVDSCMYRQAECRRRQRFYFADAWQLPLAISLSCFK